MIFLVTGAAGFIGSRVVAELSSRGHQVCATDMFLDRLYPNSQKERNWKELSILPGVDARVIDLRFDLSSLPKNVDVIINEAGMPGLMTSWSDFDIYLSCNVKLVQNLIEHYIESDPHFIQASTSSVYGANATGPESSPLKPTSPYGVTKLAAEELINAYSRTHGLRFTTLRYFSVFGPGQRPDMAYNKIINAIVTNQDFVIYGDGSQSRTNTSVFDVASATATVGERQNLNDVFNISGNEIVSLISAVRIIEGELGKEARITFLPPRPGDQMHTSGVITKAERSLGFRPSNNFKEVIRDQIRWQIQTL